MVEVRSTPTFVAWFDALADATMQSRIAARIARFQVGLFGDVEPVGSDIALAQSIVLEM